jgi:mannosyltransferase
VSSAPTGQRDAASSPLEPEGQSVPAATGVAAAGRSGGWAATAARYAPVGAGAATMAVIGLWGLARDAMGNDEVATRYAALLSLRQLFHLLSNVDAVHGTYYLLMHGWMALGTSPTIMRIPSLISMIAAAAIIVIIGRRLTGSGWAGLFAGLIMALTPIITFYAQTARAYAMVFTCVLGSTLALLRALETETGNGTDARIARRWLSYGALVTLGGYLNELSLLVLAAHAVTVLLTRYGRRTVGHWAAAAAAGAVLVVPLVLISIPESSQVGWIPPPDFKDLGTLFHDYFGGTNVAPVLVFVLAAAALLPPRSTWRLRPGGAGTDAGAMPGPAWWSRGGVSLPSVAAPLLVMPASVLILESLLARPLYIDRYVLYGEAGAALLAGAGLYRIGRWLGHAANRRALVWVVGASVCLCVLLLQLGPYHFIRAPGSREFNYGGPARYVRANAQPGDGVLFFNSFYRKARLGYPRDFQEVSDFAMAVPPMEAGTFNGLNKPFAVIRPLMLAHRRIWVVGRSPYAVLRSPPIRAEGELLKSRFTLIAERHFKGIVITLWLRRRARSLRDADRQNVVYVSAAWHSRDRALRG